MSFELVDAGGEKRGYDGSVRNFENAVSDIASKLDEDGWFVKCTALQALGALGGLARKHVDAVAAKLDDPLMFVKSSALEALGSLGELAGSHVPAIVDLVRNSLDREIKVDALKALRALGEVAGTRAEVCDVVRKISRNDDHSIDGELIRTAIETLGSFGHGVSVEDLDFMMAILEKKSEYASDDYLKLGVITALGSLGGYVEEKHIDAVAKMLDSENNSIVDAALKALGNFGPFAYKHANHPVFKLDSKAFEQRSGDPRRGVLVATVLKKIHGF